MKTRSKSFAISNKKLLAAGRTFISEKGWHQDLPITWYRFEDLTVSPCLTAIDAINGHYIYPVLREAYARKSTAPPSPEPEVRSSKTAKAPKKPVRPADESPVAPKTKEAAPRPRPKPAAAMMTASRARYLEEREAAAKAAKAAAPKASSSKVAKVPIPSSTHTSSPPADVYTALSHSSKTKPKNPSKKDDTIVVKQEKLDKSKSAPRTITTAPTGRKRQLSNASQPDAKKPRRGQVVHSDDEEDELDGEAAPETISISSSNEREADEEEDTNFRPSASSKSKTRATRTETRQPRNVRPSRAAAASKLDTSTTGTAKDYVEPSFIPVGPGVANIDFAHRKYFPHFYSVLSSY